MAQNKAFQYVILFRLSTENKQSIIYKVNWIIDKTDRVKFENKLFNWGLVIF